jgi:hypothetical protein
MALKKLGFYTRRNLWDYLQGSASLAKTRQSFCRNSTDVNYASRPWLVFRTLISGALDSLADVLGTETEKVMSVIDEQVNLWFTQVLQLDLKQLRLEA